MIRHLLIPLACLCLPAAVLAAPVPVPGEAPVPVDRLRLGNTNVLPMTGTWRFSLEHGISPAVKGELPADAAVPDFASPDASDAGWTNILVPANWEIEGFSPLTFQERPATSHDIGLYRRWVNVPASFASQTVLWHFDGAYDGAEVFVNGQRCGYHESGFTAFNIDVTHAIKAGQRNLFAVRLYKDTSSASLDHGDFWVLGGIYRETYLVALPPLHVDDVTVVTDLDDQYKDATLKSAVRVAGPAGAHFIVTGELYCLDGAKVEIPAASQAGDIGAAGVATVNVSAPVTAPRLWNAEKPNLYYVFYRLSDGNRTVERVQDRIGFRKLENKGGVQLLNGVPVKYTGICRMEEFSPYGHAMNEDCWKTDIILMKADNINAIRLSHYDHAERFMELCDEAGFYLLDEIPACWIASEVRNASRTWAYVLRTQETMDRDKNRPSVVAWACGNESGYGVNNQAMFDYAKAHDPTRPAFISQQNQAQNPRTDFEDYHYPTLQQLRNMANPNHAQIPVIITEQHSTDVGVAEVTNYWNIIWPADNIVGSFIWEWQAQGMYDKFPERWSIPSPRHMVRRSQDRFPQRPRTWPRHRRAPDHPHVRLPQNPLQPCYHRRQRGLPGGRQVHGPDPEPLLLHRSFRTRLPLAGAGRRQNYRRRRHAHCRQTTLLGGRLIPRHPRLGHVAPGVLSPGRPQRVRRQLESESPLEKQLFGQNSGGVQVETIGRADLNLAGHAPELARGRGVLEGLAVSVIDIAVVNLILKTG